MDSEEDDYSQDYRSDWSEEEAGDCMDVDEGGESNDPQPQASAAVDLRKTYKILTEEDIKHLQETDISTVSGALSVPRGVACALLCRNNWSLTSVYDHWFAAAPDNGGERNPKSLKHICKICYENTDRKEAVSAACGHPFCADCLKSYIAMAISGGAGCLTLECPERGCGAAVTSDMVEKLCSEDDVSRYHQYLRRSYVESSRNRKWCPAAGCDRAVELEAAGNDSYDYDVVCGCLTAFCWRCSGERHDPLGCAAAAEWAESARWILAHTKPCPNCRRPIQKSEGGCDHMVCAAPCRFEFCWACSVPWIRGNDHCRRCAEERERKAKERQERLIMKEFKAQPNSSSSSSNETTTKAMAKRKRFTGGNCYERWVFNEKTRKRAMADLEEAKKKYTGEGRGGMQFVVEAWEQIVECWNVLNWSYVYVYSLPETMGKRAVLEHFQAVAEAALEQLQCYAEEGILDGDKRVFRIKLVDLTKVASHRFESLVLAMKNEVEGFAPYWEKEALELKNDIAIAETIALDMEKEALEEKNHIAIALSYALDLHDLEMAEEDSDLKKDLGEVEVESCSLDSDKALDLKNEVGSCVFNLEKDAIDLKNNLAEAGSRVFKLEKETLDLKNNIAEVERHALDLEKDSLNLKNDLAEVGNLKNELGEVESCALELEKKAVDLKSELAEVGSSDLDLKNDKAEIESYVLVSEVKKNDIAYDDDDEYVLVSEEEEEEEAQDSKKTRFT